jgi:hypothetical protein
VLVSLMRSGMGLCGGDIDSLLVGALVVALRRAVGEALWGLEMSVRGSRKYSVYEISRC